MKEAKVDLFDMILDPDTDAICLTTNGQYNHYGHALMGGGCAGAAAQRWTELPRNLGNCLKSFGCNIPYIIGALGDKGEYIKPELQVITNKEFKCLIFSYPTIHNLMDGGDLQLVKQSAQIMKEHANNYKLNKIIVPRPAVGIAGLQWTDVKKEIEDILDDRFLIVSFDDEE